MTGLEAAQRAALERLIVRARSTLEKDLEAQAEGRYGINRDGTIEDKAALHLDPSALADRREIVAIVEHLRNEGESATGAVARLIREAAFTHLNRLVAIRVAEAMGLVPPSIGEGRASRGFREVLEVAPLLAGDETNGYWAYLQLCGDEMAGDAPALFDPRNPLLTLSPSVAALDDLVTLFSDPAAQEIWIASDTFGWAYQFFNTGDERRQMREESQVPRNSRELAVRNQFFTPRYVIDFLVQNTLGRRLLEAEPDSQLIEALPLLVDPPTEAGEPLPLDEVRVLDPACGSGHFLLGCYDLLEDAWQLRGVEPADAAPLIVPTLWGIDIDPRCAQVASAAIVFRARRHCRDLPLPRPSVITARSLPDGSESWEQVLASLPTDRRDLVQRMREALVQAPILGPALKVEERLAAEIRRHFTGSDAADATLAEGIAPDAFGAVELEVLDALQRVADSASSSPAQRLLAAEADDAIRFVEAMRQRYDVVLMNPPFGAVVPETEDYLRAAYPRAWTEFYAVFIERGLDLLRGRGFVGAITSSQYFVTKRLKDLRDKLIRKHRPLAIIDLGAGILHGATVNTALIVLPQSRSSGATRYEDLTTTQQSGLAPALTRSVRAGASHRDLALFLNVPGAPFALHLPAVILDHWQAEERFEPSLAIVRTGGKSFHDFRYLRLWWELDAGALRRGWTRYQKGGEYQPYWSPAHLLYNWKQDGAEVLADAERNGVTAQVLQSSSLWRKPGLCFPRVGRAFGVRVMPESEIFGEKAISIFPKKLDSLPELLGVLNSTVTAELLQVFGRGRSTENGSVKALPYGPNLLAAPTLSHHVDELLRIFDGIEAADETSTTFAGTLFASASSLKEWVEQQAEEAVQKQRAVDAAVASALGVSERFDHEIPSSAELVEEVILERAVDERTWASSSISIVIGAAFGRWDVREFGRRDELPRRTADYLRPIPALPPAMLVPDLQVRGESGAGEYPLAPPPAGLLLDEPGHAWDIENAISTAAAALFDDADASLAQMLKILGRRSVREYLRRQFFKDHLARYSKSRRRAPIYWPLAVPSRNWGMWVYAPALSRETLFAIAGEVARREALAAESTRRLQAERDAGGTGRSIREVTDALTAEEALAEELGTFKAEAERIAGLGWEPDLDDGIILCAAPLASLFPAWPDAAKEREQIRKGEYPWATVSRWKDAL